MALCIHGKLQKIIFTVYIILKMSIGLMVSKISYYSFKDVDFQSRVPFFVILVVVLVSVFAAIDPPVVLFTGFFLYALSGPVIAVLRRFRKRSHRAE